MSERPLDERMAEARRLLQEDSIAAAERKLARRLTSEEKAGLRHIESLMMLEAVEQSFSHPSTTAESIETDLDHFKSRAP